MAEEEARKEVEEVAKKSSKKSGSAAKKLKSQPMQGLKKASATGTGIPIPHDLKAFVMQAHADYMTRAAQLGQIRMQALVQEQPAVQAAIEAQKRFNERAADIAKSLGLDPGSVILDIEAMEFRTVR